MGKEMSGEDDWNKTFMSTGSPFTAAFLSRGATKTAVSLLTE